MEPEEFFAELEKRFLRDLDFSLGLFNNEPVTIKFYHKYNQGLWIFSLEVKDREGREDWFRLVKLDADSNSIEVFDNIEDTNEESIYGTDDWECTFKNWEILLDMWAEEI